MCQDPLRLPTERSQAGRASGTETGHVRGHVSDGNVTCAYAPRHGDVWGSGGETPRIFKLEADLWIGGTRP